MKVILLHDIAKVGRKFDVKDVADGYAINSLIPKGAAEAATPSALKRLEKARAEELARRAAAEALLAKDMKKVNGEEVSFVRPANEKGHLFAAIHEGDIVAAIAEKYRLSLEPKHIKIEKPIKEVGSFRVHLEIGETKGALTVVVTGAAPAKEEQAGE